MEAEMAVLGAVLLDNATLRTVKTFVKQNDFYAEVNQRIFKAILELADVGQPIDPVTLGEQLRVNGDFEKIGGATSLANLTDSVATIANVDHYAKIVAEKAARRRMIYTAQEIVAQGYSDGEETSEYLIKSRSSIALAANYLAAVSSGPRQIDDDIREINKDIVRGGPPPGVIKTGFQGVDYISGGLWPGFLHVLAARPSMGKSLVAVNIANNASLRGDKVLYVTLEDTRKATVYRMLARFADIDLTDLTLGRVKEYEQFQRLNEATIKLSGNKPLWLEDTAGLTSDAVVQIAAAQYATHGLDLLIIDHLHEVTDQGESETVITSHASQNFRNIAKDLNIPVLLIAQLNRKLEERKDKHPTLADLRQSGTIEQVARWVWFLFRESYYTKETHRRDLEWDIAKANQGRTGMVKMWTNLPKMYARDWDPQTDGLWPAERGADEPEHRQAQRQEQYQSDTEY
jgi:replicative DNA helicase